MRQFSTSNLRVFFVSDEILDDLADEFGKGILSSSHPHTGLTLRQCQILLNEHGLEKSVEIIEEWKRTGITTLLPPEVNL
jgi:hypothetical protein